MPANCTFSRLCSINTTTTLTHGKYASRIIEDPATGELMVAWVERASVRFARFNTDTLLPNSEASIFAYTANSTVRSIDMVRLSDGRLVVVWYAGSSSTFGNETVASESGDGGVTWTATPTQLDTTAGTQNEFAVGMYDNGTNVVVCVKGLSSGGVGAGDMKAYTRTAASVWTQASASFYVGTAGGTPAGVPNQQESQMAHGLYMSTALIGVLVYWCGEDGSAGNTSTKLTAWTTGDGFATATRVTIHTFTANNGGAIIELNADGNGRLWLMTTDKDNNEKPRIFYSDDVGATWTNVGIPTIITTTMATLGITTLDASYDVCYAMDALYNLVVFHGTGNTLTPNGRHMTYRSVDPTTTSGWAVVGECAYDSTVNAFSGISASRGFIDAAGDLWRLAEMTRGATYYTLEFLGVPSAGIPDEAESPETVAQAPAFANNVVLRKDVAYGLGWSLLGIGVSCFMRWSEGDRDTGREREILCYGATNIDPVQGNPAYLPVISRMETEDDDGFGERVTLDLDDTAATYYDARRYICRTKDYTIDSTFGEVVLYGLEIEYRCDNPDGLLVQVWSDGQLVDTVPFPCTYGVKLKLNEDLTTDDNLGRTVQVVIDEISNYEVNVDSLELVFIRKGRRG